MRKASTRAPSPVVLLLTRGATYGEIAARMHLSAGRVLNIASSICGKLFVKSKRELKRFVYWRQERSGKTGNRLSRLVFVPKRGASLVA